jgi:hypothetical protein
VIDCRHEPPIPTCRLCHLAGRFPWPPAAVPSSPARCRYLGAIAVGLRGCESCTGRVQLKEFPCALRLGQGSGGAAAPRLDCPPGRDCPGYQPAE